MIQLKSVNNKIYECSNKILEMSNIIKKYEEIYKENNEPYKLEYDSNRIEELIKFIENKKCKVENILDLCKELLIDINKWNYENQEVSSLILIGLFDEDIDILSRDNSKSFLSNITKIYEQLLKEQNINILNRSSINKHNQLSLSDALDTHLSYNYGIHAGNSSTKIKRSSMRKVYNECNYFFTFETINIPYIFWHLNETYMIESDKNYKNVKKYAVQYIGYDFNDPKKICFTQSNTEKYHNYENMICSIGINIIKNESFSKYDRVEYFNQYEIEDGKNIQIDEECYKIGLIRRIKKYYKKLIY
jgi:hypothetical protein